MTSNLWRRLSLRFATLLAVGLLPMTTSQSPAQTVVGASWTGGASGSWFTIYNPGVNQTTNWTTNVVPNNGNPTNTEYAVTIGGPAGVNVAVDTSTATIDSLSLSATNGTVTITGGLDVTGANGSGISLGTGASIAVNGSGILYWGGSFAVQGGNGITLGGSSSSIRASGTQTLTNGSTIQGAGTIGYYGNVLTLTNQAGGLINANVSAGTLTVEPAAGSTNAGTLEASNGGTLTLTSGAITNTGTITALTGSTVNLNSMTITAGSGGQLSTAGTGVILGNSVTLDGTSSPTVNAGNFQVGTTSVTGTLTNSSAITFATNGILYLSGATTFNGSGTVTLTSGAGSIRGSNPQTLTNATTIAGAGDIGIYNSALTLTNQANGLINANVSGGTLLVEPATGSTNAGTLEATNGGILTLTSGAITNTSTITALNGSTVNLTSMTITAGSGGRLTTAGTGVIVGNSVTLDGTASPTVNAGSFQIGTTTSVTGTLTNSSAITFGTNGILYLSGATTLNGSGTVTLTSGAGSIRGSSPQTLTNATTIAGAGDIGIYNSALTLTNQANGLINANVSGGTLLVEPATGSTNAGTLEATNGGILTLTSGAITNTSTITALNGSTVNLTSMTITAGSGGRLTTAGTGVIVGNSVTLDGTASPTVNAGSFQIGTTTSVTGTLTNSSAITFGTNGILYLSGATTLNGSGTVTLASGAGSIRGSGAQTLTNASTIAGAGDIGIYNSALTLTNQATGLINANVSGGTLLVEPATGSTNAGTLEATNGGILTLTSGAITNTGTIIAAGTGASPVSTVNLSSYTLVGGIGGQLTTTSNGLILGSSVTLDGTTGAVVNSGAFQVASTSVIGTITNNGTVTFGTNGLLYLVGATTLNGSGAVTLGSGNVEASGAQTLTNASTIVGAGTIGYYGSALALINQAGGQINANVSGGMLTVYSAASSTNAGTMEASNGGVLVLGGALTNSGTIAALAGSTASLLSLNLTNLSGNTLTGGTYQAIGAGSLVQIANNANITQLVNATVSLGGQITDQSGNDAFRNLATIGAGSIVQVLAGATETFSGPLTVTGALQVNGGSLTIGGGLNGGGAVSVAAGSTITINAPAGASFSGGISGGGSLTVNGPGTQTLSGTNTFSGGVSIVSGTLQVPADTALGSGPVTFSTLGTLSYSGTTATARSFALNDGTLAVAAGQTVTLNGGLISNGFLDGAGTFATSAANGARFALVTATASVSVKSNNANDQFVHFDNSGAFSLAAGVNTGGNFNTTNLNGFTTEGTGSVTIGAGSQLNVANFQSYGMMNLTPATVSGQFTELANLGTSPLGFNGGSQTFVGTAAAPNANVVGVDLHGQNMVIQGGLFVNNGLVFTSTGSSTIFVDYGATYKGAGTTNVPIVTQNGGKVSFGNCPGTATFGSLVLGSGGIGNLEWEINDAGPSATYPNAPGVAGPKTVPTVSGWSLGLVASQTLRGGTATYGNLSWTATPGAKFDLDLETLAGPSTLVGSTPDGLMADFDPTQSYSWPIIAYQGVYSGPTSDAELTADTIFDRSQFANAIPVGSEFGLHLDQFPTGGGELDLVFTPSPVPEPGTLVLTGLAGLAAGWVGRRRRAKAAA